VTDDDGAEDTDTQSVTVTSGGSFPITLTADGYKIRGSQYVDLTWIGATSPNVDIYRDNEIVTMILDEGAYTDVTGAKGGATYVYKVCEAGTSTCSNVVTVTI
ncbi:peptidase S8, partial [Gemmatimonadota bacterium]